MKEEKLSKTMKNFKIEELEPRLEMGRWSAGSERTRAVGPEGDYISTYNATYTIRF